MCLIKDSFTSIAFLRDNYHKEEIEVYKEMKGEDVCGRICICTPHRETYTEGGWLEAWGKLKTDGYNNTEIGAGAIHVYLNKTLSNSPVVLKCKAKISDFIGINFGKTHACFTKIYIPKEEIDRLKEYYAKQRSIFGSIRN